MPSRIAHHDQVALGFEQAAGPFLGLLQFPIAVGERLIVQDDRTQLSPQPAQPHAQGRERDTGDGEQQARDDREGIGVVAGLFGRGADDEAIGAAERSREDHEGADREEDARMTPRETSHAQFEPESASHRR